MIHPESLPETPNLESLDAGAPVPNHLPDATGTPSVAGSGVDGTSALPPTLGEDTFASVLVPDGGMLMDSMTTMQTQPISEDAAQLIAVPDTGMLMDSMSTMQTQPTD